MLKGSADLSPEQAQAASIFFALTPSESRYFLFLVLYARSGTPALRDFYETELKKLRDDRLLLKNRVQAIATLTGEEQARYYSSWIYAALHVAISLPQFKSKEQLAEALSLPQNTVSTALEFLVLLGIIQPHGTYYRQGERSLYLGADSPYISKHHTNWRIQAIQSLDKVRPLDLHYSGVIACSEKDLLKVREILVEAIQRIRNTVKESKDETMYAYCLDLFGLLR